MKREILYATNNPGKVAEISKLLNYQGITVTTPKALGIDLDVSEVGTSLEANAVLKVKAFQTLVGDRLVVADDTGLEIDALNGEPGIHVRRWRDGKSKMTDEEIIAFCLERMKGVVAENRGAQFRTVLALGIPDQEIEIVEGRLRGIILEAPSSTRVEGFPFESLFYVPSWGRLLGEVHRLPASAQGNLKNHREQALEKTVPRIKELFASFDF